MELPKRKSVKLKNYDYSSNGSYFVTICVRDRMRILSSLCMDNTEVDGSILEFIEIPQNHKPGKITVKLTDCGKIAERELLGLGQRYDGVSVEKYIIMPDHIHAIIRIRDYDAINDRVSLHDIVGGFKSLVSRACSSECGVVKIFQRSYSEHIIRSKEEYDDIKEYISKNPIRWYYSKQ